MSYRPAFLMRPMLAIDVDLQKLKFPVYVQPKIDGVRALVINDQLRPRSLKKFKNKYINIVFSNSSYNLLDGELILGPDLTSQSLCRDTTSAVNTIEGEPNILFIVFDIVSTALTYEEKLERLKSLKLPRVSTVPSNLCLDLEEVLGFEKYWLEQGYEGIILRAPNSIYKFGRSTMKEQKLMRLKRFQEMEARIIGFNEEFTNCNESIVNSLGLVSRSSHKENKVPNNTLGSFLCEDNNGRVISVSRGTLTEGQREEVWNNKDLYMGKRVICKYFPYGEKDKPRFPTFKEWK